MATISEKLFEKFCIDNSISFSRIIEKEYPTPDYIIKLGECIVYVEVKQLDKNKEDKLTKATLEKDKHTGRWESIDERLRHKIDDARRQFQKYKNGEEPTLLVVYDNTRLGVIEPEDILTAMYGDEKVFLIVKTDNNKTNLVSYSVRFGGNKKMTPNINTSISAISILNNFGDGSLFLYVYHNIHAKNPMNPSLLLNSQVAHFTINENGSDMFQEWQII